MKTIIKKGLLLNLLITILLLGQSLKTQHISIAEGLSNAAANVIHQDKYGILWVGTEDGLNRYDGYKFKVYKNVPGNSESLIENRIWDISEDDKSNLWIATHDGISYYNRTANRFINYALDSLFVERNETFPKSVSIHVTSDGTVFAGTVGSGLLIYNAANDKFEKAEIHSDTKINALDVIYRLAERNGVIYAGDFNRGLLKYNSEKKYFEEVNFTGKEKLPNYKNFTNRISKLYLDHSGDLWIISDLSIYKLNTESNVIRHITDFKTDEVFNLWLLYTALIEDKEGNIWIGKDLRGIYKFDGISDEFEMIPFGEEYSNRPNTYNETIRSMFLDNTGIVWIGTYNNGLFKYDPMGEPFIHYKHDPDTDYSISGNELFGLYESKVTQNLIYVGTRGTGLNKFNPETKRFTKVSLNFLNDVFGGSVRSILEDKDGSLYIGTWGDGLFKYSDKTGARLISKWDSLNNSSLSGNLVRVLSKDSDGLVWIGTSEGLNIYDPAYDKTSRVYTKNNAMYSQEIIDLIRVKSKSNNVIANHLQVGDSSNLSTQFSIERPRDFLIVSVGEGLPGDKSMSDYGWLENEKEEKLWSAGLVEETFFLGGAIKNRIKADVVRLKPGNYKLRYVSDESHSFRAWNAAAPLDSNMWGIQIFALSSEESSLAKNTLQETLNRVYITGTNIWSVHMSRREKNTVWIATSEFGLDKYYKNNNTIKNYSYDPKNPNSLSNNSVQFIHEDDNGILWLATNGGLNRFDPIKEEFTVYTEEDGLPTNYIASILEDDFDNLWLSTRNGISRMTLSKGRPTFVNYDSKDGLGGSDFISLVALKSTNGKLYFGGEHGLNEIIPGTMNTNPPNLIFTDLKIGNKSITLMREDSPTDKSIYELDKIELTHDQNDLSFEFAALHFARADKNQYAHILEGYDEQWFYDNRKYAAYTNLDPGEYVFKFRGSNSDGVWNDEGKFVSILILPPWWQTTWAYVGYVLLFIGLVLGIDRFQRRRLLAKVTERRRLEEAETRAKTAELQAKATEAERKMLEAENHRKTEELEEARQLQLSMLPRELPQLPNLDIAVYMKTATEVGGDYYDFHVGMDGTLTVVLGDATGHGMKAGTMVTSVKSLFNVLAPNPDIVVTFHEITRCIKLMQMEKLSMCMTMLKIKGDALQMSAAGMPPTFIYKHNIKTIEEHVFKGMPLGTMDNFPYDNRETKLEPGDTILVMSDGFPELQNKDNEQYGYKKTRNKFEEVAEGTPEQIIDILKNEGSDWVDGTDPDDDVTFVVIKVK